MTEPTYDVGGPVAPATGGGGLAGAFGPEAVAAVLSIVVVVALLGSRLAFAGGAGGGPTPSPSVAATDGPTRTAPVIDAGAIGTLLSVDANLIAYAGITGLQGELDPLPVNADAVRNLFANMTIQLVAGEAAARRLAATPAGAAVAAQLLEVYGKVGATIDSTDNVQLSSQATWQKAAREAVATIGLLPALDAQLRALLVAGSGPSPSASPGESPAISPSVAPSATVAPPTATIPPSSPPPATAPPSTAPPSQPSIPPASPTLGPNAISNPGFEKGVGSPWALFVSGSGEASLAQDGQQPLAGALSARIDISVPTLSPAFVSLQQGGLLIEAGATYEVSLLARAAAPRQVRVRITGPDGQTLGNGSDVFTIGPSPSQLSFPMSSIVPTDGGMIRIDVGANNATVWLDDVSFSRVGGGP